MKNTKHNTSDITKVATAKIHVLLFGTEAKSIESLRATLEVAGHTVTHEKTALGVEKSLCTNEFEAIFVSTDSKSGVTAELFETLSLIKPNLIVAGFATNPTPDDVIQFVRCGGCDFFSFPDEYNFVNYRLQLLIQKQKIDTQAQRKASSAQQVIEQIEEENDALSKELANNYCETEKKIQQVAMGAEFQTLVSQELEVESMLRTALGYMLTRVGATNAAVYLREGTSDWGIGAYINYDRQPEHFQSLIDVLGPAVCHTVGSNDEIQLYKNGGVFADQYGLDRVDFSGSEVVTCSCYSGKKCMAVVTLFRDESRSFDADCIDTIDTLRAIFGQQLGTILKIHQRAETQWPSESYGDDDWSIDTAA